MRRALGLLLAILAAMPLAAATRVAPAVGVLRQGQVDSSDGAPWGPQVCTEALTPVALAVHAVAWAPGDVLTVRLLDLASPPGAVSGTTTGTPPSVTLQGVSRDGCAHFEVVGTRVAVAVAYQASAS